MIYILLADGFEEVEAISPLDVMRRNGIDVMTAGVDGREICGAHDIKVTADTEVGNIDVKTVDGIILPGGMPGTLNLQKNEHVNRLIKHCRDNELLLAAICAAPMILGELGILEGKRAVCFHGFEDKLCGAEIGNESVVTSGNIITAKGAGVALLFGAAIVDYLSDSDGVGEEILANMQYPC